MDARSALDAIADYIDAKITDNAYGPDKDNDARLDALAAVAIDAFKHLTDQ